VTQPVVLENALVVSYDGVARASLAFDGGRVGEPGPGALHIDLSGHAVFPGLINAHDHLQLNNVPALAHDEPFANSYEWIDAFEAQRGNDAVTAAVAVPKELRHWQGALKNVLAGATTVAHHDPMHLVHDDPDFPVTVVREFGWSHSAGLSCSRDGAAPRYGPPVAESFGATPNDQPWIIHLAEGVDDVAGGELAWLDAAGCVAANTVLVHGVGLSRRDVERCVERGTAVVWCPASNLQLFGRTLDPHALFRAQRLALGTDSRLTGSRDLLDELRVAAACARLSPKELLRLVTLDAARILRLDARGGLDRGCHADCVIVRGDGDPYTALLETTRTTIRAVVRGGRPVVTDLDFADWFDHCGVEPVAVRLDGVPKLMARGVARAGAIDLEPGLALVARP
jgi:cytosine/adenosine deaminase-related metal-dependent hydrolase